MERARVRLADSEEIIIMQKSFSTRLKVTKQGKVRRRATTLGHSRTNKSGTQLRRKRALRGLKGVHHEELSKNLTG